MPDRATALYGNPTTAFIMEMPPCESLWQKLAMTYGATPADVCIGTPDLRAARAMTDLGVLDVAFVLGVSSDVVEAIEAGDIPMTMPEVLTLCSWFAWPIGVLFRNPHGLHANATVLTRGLRTSW